jgi:cytochrome c biogenesis protein CcmG/thiol:disulfide interchange protein DsbE
MELKHTLFLPVFLLMVIPAAVLASDEPAVAPGPLPAADFQLAAFEGQVVLVDFWASWCVPCRDSLPWLNAMQQKYGDKGLQVVMVNLDKDEKAAAEMAVDIEAGIRQFLDPAGGLAARYELEGMPSSYLYDGSGELISSHIGFLKAEGPEREKALLAALKGGEK